MYTTGRWPVNLRFTAGTVKSFPKNFIIPLDLTHVGANLHRKFPKRFGKSQHISPIDSGSTMIRNDRIIPSVCQNLLAYSEWAVES